MLIEWEILSPKVDAQVLYINLVSFLYICADISAFSLILWLRTNEIESLQSILIILKPIESDSF